MDDVAALRVDEEREAVSRRRVTAMRKQLRLPVVVAPMFLISGPAMVIASCRAGLIGSFPAANARCIEMLEDWCERISCEIGSAPWAMNVLAHQSYLRFDEELKVIARYRPPLLITALGSPVRVIETVHSYDGLVLADVATPRHARKAAEAGVDGLVLVCAGAGGHTGTYSPFAFMAEVRAFWSGPIVLSGAISDAPSLLAAEMLGADLAYMGTRFLASEESLGEVERKNMTVEASMEDTITSAAITGVPANWLRQSLRAAGLSEEQLRSPAKVNFSTAEAAKPWKNIWGAGQGVGSVRAVEPVASIAEKLLGNYQALRAEHGLS